MNPVLSTSASIAINPAKAFSSWFIKDARHFQILYLGLFLCFGWWYLGWRAEWLNYLMVFAAGLGVQALFIKWKGGSWSSLKSAAITCLGLSLLLKTNSPWTMAFAGALAMGGKFLIKDGRKHIFNPANFGIIMVLILTGDGWVSPGQWGSELILLYFFGAAALMVLLKVGRIDTSVTFLLTFLILEACRSILYMGWTWDVLFHKLCNGSLLLFAFFMITDPVTTPRNPKARIIWSILIGVASFCLTNWFYVHTAPIWALFFAAPLTALLNRLMKGKQFQW